MNATNSRRRPYVAPRLVRALVVAAYILCSSAEGAGAQAAPASASPPEPAGYSDAIEAALNEHQRGNFEEARSHFQRAHELYPNARTLRGLGKVEFELRNYGEAVRYLREALDSKVKPLDDELRVETQELLKRAKAYVGEFHVDVDPGSATVAVDGVTVASGPRVSLSLVVGDHILDVRALGRISERRPLRVHGGEETVIQIVLPVPAVGGVASEPAGAPRRTPHDDRASSRRKVWIWSSIGVAAAAALAVGLGVGLTRDHQKTRVGEAETSPNTPPGALLTALRRAE